MYTKAGILDRLNNVEEKNGVYWANCPCHDDNEQSLMITEEDGRLVLACSVCGAQTAQIVKSLDRLEKEKQTEGAESVIKSLDQFQEEKAEWLIPGWLPEGQVILLASDGGVGKTTLWCHIVAALSAGKRCILDPEGYERDPMKVAFFSSEDSVTKKLYRKIVDAGADSKNIMTTDSRADKTGVLRNFKFGTGAIERFVQKEKPKLCVFDPLQGFLPPKVNMGSRNEMRDCLAPLIRLGEKTGTTFLIVCHTNKRKGASGRDRVSDSADLWDLARAVMMMGYTEEQGIRYISNEKNNYGDMQQTLLVSISKNGTIVKEGNSWKRDREYMAMSGAERRPNKVETCQQHILKLLTDAPEHIMRGNELNEQVKRLGSTDATINRARKQLCADGHIRNEQIYSNGMKGWYVRMCAKGEPNWEDPVPFDQVAAAPRQTC